MSNIRSLFTGAAVGVVGTAAVSALAAGLGESIFATEPEPLIWYRDTGNELLTTDADDELGSPLQKIKNIHADRINAVTVQISGSVEDGPLTVSGSSPSVIRGDGGASAIGGWLAVDGAVKIGKFASRPTCDSGEIGLFIFDTAQNRPYICASDGGVGGAWKPLDSDFDKDGLTDSFDNDDTVPAAGDCGADGGGWCFVRAADKSAIEPALTAANIRSGANIFGVAGDAAGGSGSCLTGGAWSEGAGWLAFGSGGVAPGAADPRLGISFCDPGAAASTPIVAADGALRGWAWSETLGWVRLDENLSPAQLLNL